MGQLTILFVLLASLSLVACGNEDIEANEGQESTLIDPQIPANPEIEDEDDRNNRCVQANNFDQLQPIFWQRNCDPATASELAQVNAGNAKKDEFLAQCYQETNSSCWCDQLVRPNPDSIDTFYCTYGANQVHQLIHPDEDTWKHAFEAVKILEELENQSLYASIVYNWWRPEPYNNNVGGSPTRHPFGTSIDIRFVDKDTQNRVFDILCDMRAQGRIRAIGYYASTALHFGIGDHRANTWGKACP